MPEVAIFKICRDLSCEICQYTETKLTLQNNCSDWCHVSDDEYNLLLEYEKHQRDIIVVNKIPADSTTEKTVDDYIEEATEFSKKIRIEEII